MWSGCPAGSPQDKSQTKALRQVKLRALGLRVEGAAGAEQLFVKGNRVSKQTAIVLASSTPTGLGLCPSPHPQLQGPGRDKEPTALWRCCDPLGGGGPAATLTSHSPRGLTGHTPTHGNRPRTHTDACASSKRLEKETPTLTPVKRVLQARPSLHSETGRWGGAGREGVPLCSDHCGAWIWGAHGA